MLELWTNGAYVATSHRVRKVREERYSFPLFFNVDYHTEVKPLPQFASRDGKQRPALRAGEHLFAQTAQTFAYLRDRVEAGELVLPDGSLEIGQFGQEALQKRCLVFGSFGLVPELTNRQILLRRRPTGLVAPDDTELVTDPAPEPADGEALVRTTYIGMDAAARTWLDGQPGYLPALQLGDVIRAAGIGEVVASRCDAYAVGDVVTTLTGFQEYVIIRDDIFTTPIPGETDQLAIMSVYGPTGATAYFGMTDIGRPQPGETVVVSAAAGATGSVAGQIAKIAGARVVGIAGGPHKCKAVVEDFGFDACIDYKEANLPAALKEHCPKGVNVYFDNVGGPILDAVLGRLAPEGTGRALRRHLQLPDRGTPRPGQLRQPACQDRAHAGIQRARRVGPLRRGVRLAAPVGGARAGSCTARPSSTASNRASTPSTGCSPAPTSARRWSRSANPRPPDAEAERGPAAVPGHRRRRRGADRPSRRPVLGPQRRRGVVDSEGGVCRG